MGAVDCFRTLNLYSRALLVLLLVYIFFKQQTYFKHKVITLDKSVHVIGNPSLFDYL